MCINSGTTNVTQPTMSTELYTDTSDGSATFRRIEDYMYGLIDSISGNVLNIKGVSINYAITEFWYNSQEGIVPTDIVITDLSFAQIDTSIQDKYNNEPVLIQNGKVVLIEARQLTEDTGITPAEVSYKNVSGNNLFKSNLVASGDNVFNNTGVSAIPAYYKFNFGDIIREDIPVKGSNGDTKEYKLTVYQIII